MYRYLTIILILSLSLACQKEDHVNIPEWLDELIQEREGVPLWELAFVARYDWNSMHIYEFDNPLSSCLYCEVYFEDGERVNWENYDATDYIESRTNYILIYDFSEN